MSSITEQIKEQIDIVDLVREYLPELKKAGLNWKARCPFHQEKTPSFTVSPEKQMWHCFGCSKGGDAFGFVKEIEGVEFKDALRILADKTGIKLETVDYKEESERGRILNILKIACLWYHKALLTAKSADLAREYVVKRGIKDSTRDSWQIGFAPDAWDGLLKYLTSRGFREAEIAKAGLAAANQRGGYYDRFRNRLLFPLSDVHGSVVGFTGRKLKEDETGGKYINTPETLVYHKGEMLFGLSRAKQSIRSEGQAIVVEGNMDCISSHQAGIENVVASSGTALTAEQVRLLKRYAKIIVLAFDPDLAGQEALMRGIQVAWQEEMEIKIIPLPEGLDPDALIRKDLKEWKTRISKSMDFMDWMFDSCLKKYGVTSASGKKEYAKVLLGWISKIPNQIVSTHYIQKLGRAINVEEKILRELIIKNLNTKSGNKEAKSDSLEDKAKKKQDVIENASLRLFSLALCSSNPKEIFDGFLDVYLPGDSLKSLYKTFNFSYNNDIKIEKDKWFKSLSPELSDVAREVLFLSEEIAEIKTAQEIQDEAKSLARRLKDNYLKNKLSDLRQKIQSLESGKSSPEEIKAFIEEWQKISREIKK